MGLTLRDLRGKFEDFAKESLKVNWHGAGTNILTGKVDFSFDLDGHVYSFCLEELKVRD